MKISIWKELKGPGLGEIIKSGGVVLAVSIAAALCVAGLDALFMALVRIFV